jgi:putative redox protein
MAKVTAIINREHFRTEITARNHTFYADEPLEDGGTDTGAMPTEFLASGLATCVAITLRSYLDRKGWDVGQITVNVEVIVENGETHFNKTLSIEGEITEEQRKRILQIADLCPVNKMLKNPIVIKTELINE